MCLGLSSDVYAVVNEIKDRAMTEIVKNHIAGSLVDGDGSFIDKYYQQLVR